MHKFVITAALVAAVVPTAPAMARQATGYTVRSTVMHAGPDYSFPSVQRLRRNQAVTVYGCLRNWSWCDVSTRYARGWVAHRDIVVNYRGRRRNITPSMGIIILSFSFGNYWDNHYRSRPFYSERPRWEQQYSTRYRQEWGPRSHAPAAMPQPRQPRVGEQPQRAPHVQTAPQRVIVPAAPRQAPQDRPGARRQPDGAPAHVPGAMQGKPASPGHGKPDNSDRDHKPPR